MTLQDPGVCCTYILLVRFVRRIRTTVLSSCIFGSTEYSVLPNILPELLLLPEAVENCFKLNNSTEAVLDSCLLSALTFTLIL